MECAKRQWLAIIYNGQCSAVEAFKADEKKPFSELPKQTTSEQHGLCRPDDFRDAVHSVSCVVVFVSVVLRHRRVHAYNYYCFVAENLEREWTGENDVSVIASITRRTGKVQQRGSYSSSFRKYGYFCCNFWPVRSHRHFFRRQSFLSWSSQYC